MWIKESRWNREGLEIDLMTEDEVVTYLRQSDALGYVIAQDLTEPHIVQVLSPDESRVISQFARVNA